VFAYIFLVMLPAKFYAESQAMDDPSLFAWRLGLLAAMGSGIIEVVGAFVAEPIRRFAPRAALLSTLAGIALGFISFGFLFKSFTYPEVGLVTLGVVLVSYFGKIKFPGGLPGGVVSLILGVLLCYATGQRDLQNMPSADWGLYLPVWCFGDVLAALDGEQALAYLGVIFSMGLFNVIGSLQNLESAEAAGDRYPTGSSLAVNGLGTLLGSLFGSCFPTTIYIGHPGWKAMGARSGYSTLNAIVCTFLCCSGSLGFIAWLIPLEAGMAVVIYIGIVISAQAFSSVEKRHFPAAVLGLLPGLGAWGVLMAKNGYRVAGGVFDESVVSAFAKADVAITGGFALEQGFILTAMCFSAYTVHIIDRQFYKASLWMAMLCLLSALGLVHGYIINGADAAFHLSPAWPWARAYGLLTVITLALGWSIRDEEAELYHSA
jgi:AGZA family xanthine/uracil permease-like MFS transporter